jgi:large subunit ribosomal protein L18e
MRIKTNSLLKEAIFLAKKQGLKEIAEGLSKPTRKRIKINVGDLNKLTKNNIIITGKVLSSGELNKKMNIIAWAYSSGAKQKIKDSGSTLNSLLEILRKKDKITGEIIA